MKLATLITKKVLVATVSVAGVGTSFVLIAPSLGISLFGDDTHVADSTTPQEEPPTAPSPPASRTSARASLGNSARSSGSGRNASQPAPGSAATATGAAIAPSGTANAATAPTGTNAIAGSNGSNAGGGSGAQPKPGDGTSQAFEIKGSVSGTLYPTVANDLVVKIENPYSFTIQTVAAAVTVGSAGSCSGEHLWINNTAPSSTGSVDLPAGQRVAAHSEVTFTVTAELQNSGGDACQNASFPLTYTGKAVKG